MFEEGKKGKTGKIEIPPTCPFPTVATPETLCCRPLHYGRQELNKEAQI